MEHTAIAPQSSKNCPRLQRELESGHAAVAAAGFRRRDVAVKGARRTVRRGQQLQQRRFAQQTAQRNSRIQRQGTDRNV